jgi:hypothetical protein
MPMQDVRLEVIACHGEGLAVGLAGGSILIWPIRIGYAGR